MLREFNKIGGHRGLGCTDHEFYQSFRDVKNLPVENTAASVKAAFNAGADYVEIDAVQSRDGAIFVHHDVSFQNGVFVPLREVLDAVFESSPKTGRWDVNVEIRGVQESGQPYEGGLFIRKLAQEVYRSKIPPENILWSSFALQNLILMSDHFPQGQYGMLFSEKLSAASLYSDCLNDVRFQEIPFNEEYGRRVMKIWEDEAHRGAQIKSFHAEVTTITPRHIRMADMLGVGINSWALFEKIDERRLALYGNLKKETQKYKVPFSVITDYIEQIKPVMG